MLLSGRWRYISRAIFLTAGMSSTYMDEFLNNHSAAEKFSTLRCEKCRKEKPIEELAGITYPERKENGGFRFREIRVCKGCLEVD